VRRVLTESTLEECRECIRSSAAWSWVWSSPRGASGSLVELAVVEGELSTESRFKLKKVHTDGERMTEIGKTKIKRETSQSIVE